MTRRHKKSATYADPPTTTRYYGAPIPVPGPSTPPPVQLSFSSSPSAVPDTDTFLRESPRYRDLGSPRAVSVIDESPTSPEPEVNFQPVHDVPISSNMHVTEPWELDGDVGDIQEKLDPAFDWDNDDTSSNGTSTPEPKPASRPRSRSPSPDRRLALSHVIPMSLPPPPMEEATGPPSPPPPGMPCLPPHPYASGADFGFEFPPPPPPPPAGANAGGAPPVGAWFNPADYPDLGDIPMPGPDDIPGFPFPPDMGGFPHSPNSGWSGSAGEQESWVRLRDVASRAMSPGAAGLSVEIVGVGDMGRRGRMKRRKSKRSRLEDTPEAGEIRNATFSGSGSRNGEPPRLASLTPESMPAREGATVHSSRTASLLRSPPRAGSPTRLARRSPSPGPSHPPLTVIAPSPVAVPSPVPPVSPSEPAHSPIAPSMPSMPHAAPPQSVTTVPLPAHPSRSSRASFDSNPSTPPHHRSPSLASPEHEDRPSPVGSRRTWSRSSSPTPSRQSQPPGQLELAPISPLRSPKHEPPRVHAEFVDAHPAFIGTWTELQRSIVECAERLDTAEGAMLGDLDGPEVVILGADAALRARLVEALVGVRLEVASDHRRPNISWTVGVPGFASLNLDAATRFVQDAIIANSYGSGVMVPLHLGSPHPSPGGKATSFKPRYSVFESGFDTARADRMQNAAAVIRLPGSSTIALDRAKVIDVDVHASELTDRMLKYLLRDLDDKLTKDLASRVRPCIAHMKAKATILSTRTKQDHTAVPTSVLLQRFCEGVGRAGRGIGQLEDALRIAVDAAAPTFAFPAGEPKQLEEPTPAAETPIRSRRSSTHMVPPIPKTPPVKHRKMVWDWNNVSPPQLVQVPVRTPFMSPRTRSGSIRSMRSRLSHRTDVLLRPVSVASVRAPPSPAVAEPTTALRSESPSLESPASSESALTRDDVVRLLECARTDELPDEFATKDVAREIMLEHVRSWDVPVMEYLDGVRAALLQDLSDLLSEHFSAVPGMRLVISKLVKARLVGATKQVQTRLEQLLAAEQQPTVGDKTAYLKLLREHRAKVHKALHKPGADVPLDHAAAEDVVARVMAYFEVALPRLVENVVRLVSAQLVREVCDPSTLLGVLGAADLCPAREDMEELATERAEQQRRLAEMRSVMLDLECAIALA